MGLANFEEYIILGRKKLLIRTKTLLLSPLSPFNFEEVQHFKLLTTESSTGVECVISHANYQHQERNFEPLIHGIVQDCSCETHLVNTKTECSDRLVASSILQNHC